MDVNKKKKPTKLKSTECSACGQTQHDVPTKVEEQRKVKSKDVFETTSKKVPVKAKGKKSKTRSY
tara:strand:+ start:3041 stop:3235 length:195 start_codon:yes stop_codon:yes gene_type:complete